MPQGSPEQPVFLIVAGPNGSGKSSVYRDADLEWGGRSVWIVNPDLLAARISEVENAPLDEANLTAVKRIEAWLEASIAVHKTIGVETVLSTDKYRRLVAKAQEIGFSIWLIYVVLDSPERSIERIKLRVAKGGHHVPDDKVRKRYLGSLNQEAGRGRDRRRQRSAGNCRCDRNDRHRVAAEISERRKSVRPPRSPTCIAGASRGSRMGSDPRQPSRP